MRNCFTILIVLFSLYGCSRSDASRQASDVSDSLNIYLAEIKECFPRQDYDKSLVLSYRLTDIGRTAQDNKALLYGYIYIAQSYIGVNKMDSAYFYFDKALPMAEEKKDDWALATIYNVLGGNAVFGEGDYSKGIAYLMEGIRHAVEIQDTSRLIPLEGNLAMAYYFINDTTGLKYAEDVYRIGVKRHNDYNTFIGAMICANLYMLMDDVSKARWYIERAVPYVDLYDSSREAYIVYADILRELGEKDSSIKYYEKAFREQSGSGLFSRANLYIGYAEYLVEDKEYDEAIDVLMSGLETLDDVRNPIRKYLIYRSLSEIYEAKEDYSTALSYYKKYSEEASRQLNLEIEREISGIRREYEEQRHELELLRWRNKYNLAVMVSILAVCVFAGLYVLYRNNVRNYRQLLRQHQTILEKQNAKSVRQSSVPMPEDKMKEMYERLEKLMYEQQLYRQYDLSRDKVAQMLSTNRTYLCSVIKSFTGMTFPYYVNSFRINEAVRILSNPEDNTPIKAIAGNLGYNNLTTFYRLFEAAKGMPPSKYRETIIQNANLADCKN